ncbi:peptidoglycan DD-metalloendopeptidase family protein [Mucilaginibacter robiniae]|uniref:Peptidoglycan DD-metalloendopeptidase family protein n=1 Tax=Mucilaginibacter robiniae TaxID=2728022 RepID=A0A7L5E0H0_9SPHI|nr:peptidoglycan DD-metalloendopeptidase family protein [Mucilaginibacter robiniae]QJD96725.1 peptidoglycan DD-metalloendopeptidase family protein [Mucilaginibacter robiniae]
MKLVKVVLLLVMVCGALAVHAQSSAELKRQRAKLNSELDDLNREYQATVQNKRASLKQLNLLKEQITLRENKITTINSEVRLLDNQISQNTNTVHSLQGQLEQLKQQYAAMIVFAYHNQSAYNKLMFVFASKDFNQAYKRLKYLQQFGDYRQRQAESIQGTQKDLHVKINQLDRTKNEKSSLLHEEENEKETLGKQQNEQVAVVNDLSKQQGQLKQQQREALAQRRRLDRQIAATIRQEIENARREAEARARAEAARQAALAAERAKAENRPAATVAAAAKPKPVERKSDSEVLTATPEAAKLSNDFLGNRGRLPWPVANGIVTQNFGTYYMEGIQMDNQGIDIKTGSGASVRAVFDGEVRKVANISGSYLLIIEHGEYFTVYSNLQSVSVARGQKVSTRQTVGTAGTDPSTGETSIGFELHKGKAAVNPKSWLAAQ